jgi:hypothetical protein
MGLLLSVIFVGARNRVVGRLDPLPVRPLSASKNAIVDESSSSRFVFLLPSSQLQLRAVDKEESSSSLSSRTNDVDRRGMKVFVLCVF